MGLDHRLVENRPVTRPCNADEQPRRMEFFGQKIGQVHLLAAWRDPLWRVRSDMS
jgi:hypothetical protein